ncbi:hypothetical protein [Streptomyces xanthophaeus]
MTSPEPAASADELALRNAFGDGFVDWLLAVDGTAARSPEQVAVARFVQQQFAQVDSRFPQGLPSHLRISHLALVNPNSGRLIINELREHAGGSAPILTAPSGDETLAALLGWAAEAFGGLLMGQSGSSIGWGSESMNRLTRAIAADPSLPFTVDSADLDAEYNVTSAGVGSSIQLATFGPSIVAAAFRQASMDCAGDPQVEDVCAALSISLSIARDVYGGATVQTTALAGLSGVFLPEQKQELVTPWGRVRGARKIDNRSFGSQSDVVSVSDGVELVSLGTGDLTVEMTVPWASKFMQPPSGDEFPKNLPTSSYEKLHSRVESVRLAFALAMDDPNAPALLPVWQKIENPIGDSGGFSFSEIARLRHRTPTRLSVEQAEEWEQWIAALDGIALDNLGHAPQRLLRAVTERHDPIDALIDAVIVWEAIFGTSTEITFRVCGSLARLLCDTIEDRFVFLKKAKGIYRMRSKIVHGDRSVKIDKISESRDEAVDVAIKALQALVRKRPDLLTISNSGDRSERIMLE